MGLGACPAIVAAMRRLIATAALVLGIAAPAWADLAAGIAAYGRGDYATAFDELLPLAEDGEARAQYYLGLAYNFRSESPEDLAEAVKWFRRGAEQGHGDSQYSLGLMYFDGRGVKHSPGDAMLWFRRAVHNGVPEAQFFLPQSGGGGG